MVQYHAFLWYSKTFLFYLYVEYDTRWNIAREGFQGKNKGTLITNNDINKTFWLAIVFECVFIFLLK